MMTDYSKLSDFEINKRVAVIKGEFIGTHKYLKNYCNNPSDAWPIIVENKISIDFDLLGSVVASYGHIHHVSDDKNPLRAAMIVFLMMEALNND